jgi:transcription elongation factor GreA
VSARSKTAKPRADDAGLPKLIDVVSEERPDAVALGRTLRVFNLASGLLDTFTIVRPGQADAGSGKLSTLSPIARGLLGHVAGETVTALTPSGSRVLRIEEVLP